MNWIKLTEQRPEEGQAIWWRHTTWPNNRVAELSHWSGLSCITEKNTLLWQPAQIPPPPDESQKAFEEWFNYHRYDFFKEPDGGMRAAWDAGCAYGRSGK